MRFLNRFSIKVNLIFAFTTTLIILLLLFAITLNRSTTIERVNKILIGTIKVKNYMYKIERDEYRFRTYKDHQHIIEFKNHFHKLMQYINTLDQDFKKFENQTKTIKELKWRLNEYKKGLGDFIKRSSEIGSEKGFLYYLNIAKKSFFIKNREIRGYNFYNEFLALEITVKNYLLSNNIEYGKKFNRDYETIKQIINNTSGINSKNKDQLIFHLNEYKRYFAKIIEISTIIGDSQESGIVGDMRIEVYKAQEKIDILIKNAEKLRIKKLRRVNRNSNIANILLSLLLVLVILFSLKRIGRSIKDLENRSLNLALDSNNLSRRINLEDKKSFQKVSENINQFISNIYNIIKEQKLIIRDTLNLTEQTKLGIINFKDNSEKVDQLLSAINTISTQLGKELPKISKLLKKEDELIILINRDNERDRELINLIKENINNSNQFAQEVLNIFHTANENIKTMDQFKINTLIEIMESLKIISVDSAIQASNIGENGEPLSIIADKIIGVENIISAEISKWENESKNNQELLVNINKLLIKNSNSISLVKTNSTNLERKLELFADRIDLLFETVISIRDKMKNKQRLSSELLQNLSQLEDTNLENIDISKNSLSSIFKSEEIYKKIMVELNHFKV